MSRCTTVACRVINADGGTAVYGDLAGLSELEIIEKFRSDSVAIEALYGTRPYDASTFTFSETGRSECEMDIVRRGVTFGLEEDTLLKSIETFLVYINTAEVSDNFHKYVEWALSTAHRIAGESTYKKARNALYDLFSFVETEDGKIRDSNIIYEEFPGAAKLAAYPKKRHWSVVSSGMGVTEEFFFESKEEAFKKREHLIARLNRDGWLEATSICIFPTT